MMPWAASKICYEYIQGELCRVTGPLCLQRRINAKARKERMYGAAEGSICMNTFFPHCPLRQEDHYWLDTCAGSTSLHYYAAVDTGLTKRNLSSICLSGRAESGTGTLATAG